MSQPDSRYDGFRIDPTTPREQPPVYGGWEQPWQDASGQWYYPFPVQGTAAAAPYAPPQVEQQPVQQPAVFVAPAELAPVGPPQYAAPAPIVRDQRTTTLAAVITFACVVIGLWAILGFLGSVASTLSSVSSGTAKVKTQLTIANKGLDGLNTKTKSLNDVADDAKTLNGLLGGINTNMGAMLTGVKQIDGSMTAMNTSLGTLETQLDAVNTTNARMSAQLKTLGNGLAVQRKSVHGMRGDVVSTKETLGGLTARLNATNSRLTHVNSVVNTMGCNGIGNNLKVHIKWTFVHAGDATVNATMIPAGAWGHKVDGSPC